MGDGADIAGCQQTNLSSLAQQQFDSITLPGDCRQNQWCAPTGVDNSNRAARCDQGLDSRGQVDFNGHMKRSTAALYRGEIGHLLLMGLSLLLDFDFQGENITL